MTTRTISRVTRATTTMEGAGVKLKRAFGGTGDANQFDPFLLLDHFGSNNPADYERGFPFHPHRGIETITYMLHGTLQIQPCSRSTGQVTHRDSMGNEGTIGTGDIQWMTAASGIIHEEMPVVSNNTLLQGFQLWANLPKSQKMSTPKYRSLTSGDIPVVKNDNVEVHVVAGEYNGLKGPVEGIVIDPTYMDIKVEAKCHFEHEFDQEINVFAFVYEGSGCFGSENVHENMLVLFNQDGRRVELVAGEQGCRFLLIAGKPLREPITWAGPIVMNTKTELETAFREYQEGTFIK